MRCVLRLEREQRLMNKVRVLLADDNVAVAKALARILETEFDVVGVVHDGHQLLKATQAFQPDIVITDLSMPLMSGLDATRQLKEDGATARIIVLSADSDPALGAAALQCGASGYVLKASAGEELFTAIHEIMNGGTY